MSAAASHPPGGSHVNLSPTRTRPGPSDDLLTVDDLVVEYPGKGFRAEAVPGAAGRLDRHQARRDRRPGGRVRLAARPPSAAPCSGWPRSPAARSRSTARTSATCTAGAPARSAEISGRLPGPVHVAEPGADDRRDPRRAARRPGVTAHGKRGRGSRNCSTRWGCPSDAIAPAAARVLRRPAPARRDRPGPGAEARSSSSATSRSAPWTCRPRPGCWTCSSRSRSGTGVSYLFVSHDLDVVRHISHRVAVMYQRRDRRARRRPTRSPRRPDHPYTQRLLPRLTGARPRPPGRAPRATAGLRRREPRRRRCLKHRCAGPPRLGIVGARRIS